MISKLELNDSSLFDKRILEKERLRLAHYQAALKSPGKPQPNKNRVHRASFGFR